jgi:Ulp1 family protease
VGNRIIPRLNLLFQDATEGKLKSFARFRRPILPVPLQRNATDSGFFAFKFMELWNGESFHLPILTVRPIIVLTFTSKTLPLCFNAAHLLSLQIQENAGMYRDQLLYYAIYHQINTIDKLPAGLEALKPRR